MTNNIEETLIEIALKIAKQKKGRLLVIMKSKFKYAPLLGEDIKPFSIFDNKRRLEALALLDGACIINQEGFCEGYAINILNVKMFKGYGTRHCAAYTASLEGNTSILASEEDNKVRIFKEGKMIMQIDPYGKEEASVKARYAVNIMESIGIGTVATVGITMLAPAIGITLGAGVIVFGTIHFMSRILNNLKNNIR